MEQSATVQKRKARNRPVRKCKKVSKLHNKVCTLTKTQHIQKKLTTVKQDETGKLTMVTKFTTVTQMKEERRVTETVKEEAILDRDMEEITMAFKSMALSR